MFVKKNDQVVVLTGADKKKKGKVLVVNPGDNRVIVEGVKIQAKHKKPRGAQNPGGIKKAEGAIDASNVQVLCPECGLPTRPSYKEGAEGKKMRVCKKCGKSLDKRVTEKKDKKEKKERKSKSSKEDKE